MSRIIHSRNELNYWIECKEAFVLQRLFRNISDQNLLPIIILLHFNKEDKFIHQEIQPVPSHVKYYLLEYDCSDIDMRYNHSSEEEMLKYLEDIGFIHICYSKDDLPIFIYQNKNHQII